MQPVLTVDEMRAVDEAAQKSVSLEALVRRAGTCVAREAYAMAGGVYGKPVALVAGPGNNGGDGRVAAALLARRGARILTFDAKSPPLTLEGVALVIDAAFGTGFRGSYEGPAVPEDVPVLSVDIPTGLDAMTGEVRGSGVQADLTVTFGAAKPGLFLGDGPVRAGQLKVERIGLLVDEAAASIWQIEDDDVERLLPRRRHDDHKWSSALMVVGGSPGMYGAPTFVARAALRSGAGMVRLGIPSAEPGQLPTTEAVARGFSSENFDEEALEELGRFKALALGPGIGRSDSAGDAVRRLVAGAGHVPTLVDADGLFALGTADQAASVIGSRGAVGTAAPVVLTPHEGEFARLSGTAPGADRIGAVRDLAAKLGAVVLLKGSTTIVADATGRVLLSTAGTSALATAGTGDVLSGVIGAFLARGVTALEAAAIGAHVHGRAATLGLPAGLVAGDLPGLVALVLSGASVGEQPGEREAEHQAEPAKDGESSEHREGRRRG